MVKNMAENTLAHIIEKMITTPVLVIGDLMLDRFVYGSVERISPESPVPVLTVRREERMLGGAGNALANLAGLNVPARIMAVIGDDEQGRLVEGQLRELGASADFILRDELRPTTVKTRFLAGHQQLLRTDFERREPIDDALADKLLKTLDKALEGVGALILSDYGKGLLRDDVIAGIIKAARAKNIPVIVDPKGQDYTKYKGASAVTPNKKELSEATKGAPVATDQDVIKAAESVIQECGIDAVIATRSAEGMSVIRKGAGPVHLPGADIEVFDVSGAGDSVIATIGAALGAGASLEQAAALANLAGSIVVTKVGTAPIRAHELLAALKTDSGDALTQSLRGAGRERLKQDRARKGEILNWDEAAEQVRRWKARGLKVGFTNGCFDILHKGHVSYLNNTHDHCDRLIVGLNSDSSVRILKGEDRPVHDEDARATVLSALGAVDMVVLFGAAKPGDDNTAIKLLEKIKPDLYFKGGDYTEDQIPEAPTVRAQGGQVKVMPVYEGHSTTGSIKKMKSGKAA